MYREAKVGGICAGGRERKRGRAKDKKSHVLFKPRISHSFHAFPLSLAPCQSLLSASSGGPQSTSKGDAEDSSLKAKGRGKVLREGKLTVTAEKRERKRSEVEGASSVFFQKRRWGRRRSAHAKRALSSPLSIARLSLSLSLSLSSSPRGDQGSSLSPLHRNERVIELPLRARAKTDVARSSEVDANGADA